MDLPEVFNDWSWSQQSISSLDNIVSYHLEQPYRPDWELIDKAYDSCVGGRNIIWLCTINNRQWRFYKADDNQWVLIEAKREANNVTLDGPLVPIYFEEKTDKKVWAYLALGTVNFLQQSLLSIYNKKIESFESINRRKDIWHLKSGMGTVTFSQKGDNVILVHTVPK